MIKYSMNSEPASEELPLDICSSCLAFQQVFTFPKVQDAASLRFSDVFDFGHFLWNSPRLQNTDLKWDQKQGREHSSHWTKKLNNSILFPAFLLKISERREQL